MRDLILINLYWFSTPFIGYAILLFISQSKRSYFKTAATSLIKLPIPSLFLVSFATFSFFMCLLSIPMYVFHLSVSMAAVLYLVILTLSVAYIAKLYGPFLLKDKPIDTSILKNQTTVTVLAVSALVTVLVFDVAVSLVTKPFVGGDAIFHMSRVVNMLSDGFNVQTSFFNNLPENAYHFNVIYSLYAIASKVLKIDPMGVWEYSLPFFRILIWTAIFTLATYVGKHLLGLARKMNIIFATMTTVAAVLVFSGVFYIAIYPSQIATAWIILLVILALETMKGKRNAGVGLVFVGLVLTMTHTIYSLIAAILLIYIVLIDYALGLLPCYRDRSQLRNYIGIFSATAVLMIGPLLTRLMPNRASYEQVNLTGGETFHLLGMTVRDPSVILKISSVPSVSYFIIIVGLISFAYLIWLLRKQKHLVSVLVATSTLAPMIFFFPPAFWTATKLLPIWMLDRFISANVFNYIAPGVVAILLLTAIKRIAGRATQREFKLPSTLLLGVIIFVISLPIATRSYGEFTRYTKEKQEVYASSKIVTNDFRSILNSNKVVVSDLDNSYYLVARFNIDVISVEYGHTPLSADGKDRIQCLGSILAEYDYGDLSSVKADYIVIPTSGGELSKLASLPYVKLVAEDPYFYVFKVTKSGMQEPKHKSCAEYQVREARI